MKHDLDVCIITCSVSDFSVSRAASRHALETLSGLVQSLHLFDASENPSLRVDSRKIEGVGKEYVSLYDKVASSDAVLLCYPIYCYTASSTAKAITEILGPALFRKPVATIVAAGSLRSHLACGDLMLSMMFEQETVCFPKSVLVTESDLENSTFKEEAGRRLDNLCRDFCDFSFRLKAVQPETQPEGWSLNETITVTVGKRDGDHASINVDLSKLTDWQLREMAKYGVQKRTLDKAAGLSGVARQEAMTSYRDEVLYTGLVAKTPGRGGLALTPTEERAFALFRCEAGVPPKKGEAFALWQKQSDKVREHFISTAVATASVKLDIKI